MTTCAYHVSSHDDLLVSILVGTIPEMGIVSALRYGDVEGLEIRRGSSGGVGCGSGERSAGSHEEEEQIT